MPTSVLKFLPWVATAILTGLLIMAYGTIDRLNRTVAIQKDQAAFQSTVITAQAQAIASRDKIIKMQSDSVDALGRAAEANRASYQANLAAASKVAADHRTAASQLLSLTAPEGELAQCRAARDLLATELTR